MRLAPCRSLSHFLRSKGGPGAHAHMLLLVLLVASLVSAFQALDTLMAVRLMMLPAAAARFWVASLPAMAALSVAIGAAYGVDFLAPQGWNTHSEASAAAVARLIRQIRRDGVRAIFIENISDPRLIERIAHESGARIGGTLYSDALSKPDGPAPTYLKLIEHNARSLAAVLQA